MIKIGLVDDNIEYLQLMKSYLKKYAESEKEYFDVQEFHNGLEFSEDYDGSLDIVFLDIEMQHMNGLEAAKKIREIDPSLGIVFVTNMAQYALKGYEVNAIDFIVKPVEYFVFVDKLKKSLLRYKQMTEKTILLETDEQIIKLSLRQIMYIEKDRNYLVYHTQDEDYRIRGTMVSVEEALSQENFSKCINGCLVNLQYVTKITRDIVWIGETQIPISRQRKKDFKEDFMKYIGGLA